MKKLIKKIHLYLALLLCLPLILQGLSGSIMAFRGEITAAILNHKYELTKGEMVSAENIIAAASAEAPEDLVAGQFKMPENGSFAKVHFNKIGEKKPVLEVILDPVSLQILEINDPSKNTFRLLKKFHEDLFISGKLGKNIVGFFGSVMLFMCISGLILWWPKTGFLKRALTFKFSDKGKKFHRDLHGAAGFWLLIPLTATSITGIYMTWFKNKESSKLWHSIHDGTFAGIYGETLIFFVGFLPLLLSITGITLWLFKRKNRMQKVL